MKKIVIAPDSFKGTIDAQSAAAVMSDAVRREAPEAEVVCLPLADGGEGTAECLCGALGGEKISLTVCGPDREAVEAFYVRVEDTAIIEVACACGFSLVQGVRAPGRYTTYGVGEMIVHAATHGCRRTLLCLGGSATNDAGAGMAAACGVRFFDAEDQSFIPVGESLCRVQKIDMSHLEPAVREMNFTVMTDVQNPLCGQNGAAYVFAPQKGADEETVRRLDDGLCRFADRIFKELGFDVSSLPGGGAAGGMGAGAVAFFNAEIQSGIDLVLDLLQFEQQARDADLILTGEGKLDEQSLHGKAISGIVRRAGNIPVVAVVGGYAPHLSAYYKAGLCAVFSVNTMPLPLERSAPLAKENLYQTVRNIIRLYQQS